MVAIQLAAPTGAGRTNRPCLWDEAPHRMNRRKLLLRLGLFGAAVGAGVVLRDKVVWRRPDVSFVGDDWLDWAEPRADTPTADVIVNGRPVRALIDSGAQYSVIDLSLVDQLDLTDGFNMPLVAYGVGGIPQMGRGTTLSVQVGSARIDRLQAAILELGQLARQDGLATPLILGQDVLGQAVLDMDLTPRRRTERRLRLMPPGTPPPPEVSPVAVRRAGRSLKTSVTVEGVSVEAVVDTGSSSHLALSEGTARRAGLLDGRPQTEGQSLVLGGVMTSRIVRAGRVAIGGVEHGAVDTPIYPGLPVPGFPAALVGMAGFRDRRVVMDLGAGTMFASRPLDLTLG